MKTLFEFTVNKKIEIEEDSIGKDSEGNEIKGKKIVIKDVPIKVAIKKPTRELSDQSTLFYSTKISEALKAGVLSEALFRKRLMNDGGVLSEQQSNEYTRAYAGYFAKTNELMTFESKKDLTDEEKSQRDLIKEEITEFVRVINQFEYQNAQLFENTAEAYANRHKLRWWILNLTYVQKSDDKGLKEGFEPFFNANDYERKLVIFDEKEEEADSFYIAAIRKASTLINYWSMGRASTEEELKKIAEDYDKEAAKDVQPA